MGSGLGMGVGAYLVGYSNGKPVYASEGNHLSVTSSFPKIKNFGRIQVRTLAKGGTVLPDCPTSYIVVRNKAGNSDVWFGGIDNDAPQVNVGMPLHEDEAVIIYADNGNGVRFVAENDYDEIYAIGYLDGDDPDITPGNPDPPDLTAPTVSSVFPTNGSTSVEINTAIYAIFDEELDDGSINTTNITVSPSISYTVAKDSVDPTKVLIIPDSDLAFSTSYTVTLTTGLTDDADDLNPLASNYPWSFTTTSAPPPPDVTPPTIVSVSPADNTTNVSININPAVSFSEDVLNSSVTSTTLKLTKVSNSQGIVLAYTHSSDGKTVTMVPGSALEYSTQYRIDVVGGSGGISDNSSNVLASSAQYTFTTEAQQLVATYSVAGNGYELLYNNNYEKVGAYINTSSSILKNGQPFKKFVFPLRKKGAPTGTISFDITNSTGTVKQALGTYNIASLSATSDTNITFEITGYTFTTNDMVTISYSGGNSSNGLYVRKSTSNATSDGTATCLRKYYSFFWNSWSTSSSEDLAMIAYSQTN